MTNYSDFLEDISSTKLSSHIDELKQIISNNHYSSDTKMWEDTIRGFPKIIPSQIELDRSEIMIGSSDDCTKDEQRILRERLLELHPWRKGPYNIFGIHVDTEWRSDWKWDRLKEHIRPLENRSVLDVGCGNGYHCWRILGNGARRVIGIDPFALSVYQFLSVKHYITGAQVWVLPTKMEKFPQSTKYFDTVFSMGVLYHRRSPFDHLIELRDSLRIDGELILETLVIDGKQNDVLVPEGRYAKMRNVWFIPSILTLEVWLKKVGFKNIRLVNNTHTTTSEQRSTKWMKFESLSDFLDPNNQKKTIEGYPSPHRAIIIAES